jgi:hypothetical protein
MVKVTVQNLEHQRSSAGITIVTVCVDFKAVAAKFVKVQAISVCPLSPNIVYDRSGAPYVAFPMTAVRCSVKVCEQFTE